MSVSLFAPQGAFLLSQVNWLNSEHPCSTMHAREGDDWWSYYYAVLLYIGEKGEVKRVTLEYKRGEWRGSRINALEL